MDNMISSVFSSIWDFIAIVDDNNEVSSVKFTSVIGEVSQSHRAYMIVGAL